MANAQLQKELREAEEHYNQLLKALDLRYPKDLEPSQKGSWDEFFNILIRGLKEEIIDQDKLRDFEKKFYSLSQYEKEAYCLKLDLDIDKKLFEKDEALQSLDEIKFDQTLDKAKSQVPDNLKPVIEYIAYSVKMKQPLPEGLLEELQLVLSPEGQEAVIQQNLQKTIDQYRRNPLNAGRMAQGANFNQAYTREQVAQILDQAQGLPTQQQQQRIQPRSQTPAPIQQRAKAKPNIEFVQSNTGQRRAQMQPAVKYQNPLPRNNVRKSSIPVMRQAMIAPVPKPKTSSVDQTKSLLDQTSGVNKHNKGLDELL
ncbi:MAG: hypothetical protein WCK98_02180 [bacterium]